MILTTEKVKQALKEHIDELLPDVPNPNKIFNSPQRIFGLGVHVLPDEAFEGLVDEDGEPANFFSVTGDLQKEFLKYWDDLKKGWITIRHVRWLIARDRQNR